MTRDDFFTQRHEQLNKVIDITKSRIDKCTTTDKIRVSISNGQYQYYLKTTDSPLNGRYIRKQDVDIAKRIAQRDYDSQVLKLAELEASKLESYQQSIAGEHFEDVYANLHDGIKPLVNPINETDEHFIQRWLSEHPGCMNSYPIHDDIYTLKHEHVRSKSEKAIADALGYFNVPYRYECEIRLNKMNKVYPDFTCLNVRTRKTWIWEHFGLMSFRDYSTENCNKIARYNENGIFIGDTMIATFETDDKGINTRTIETLIKRYLL